jgi:hypothetical protein
MYLKFLLWCVYCVGGAWLICGLMGWTGCVSESAQRQHWQDCANIHYVECWDESISELDRDCTYRHYMECING